MRKRGEWNVILFESIEHQLIGVGTLSVTVKIGSTGFFFLQHKEHNGSVLGQSTDVGYRLKTIIHVNAFEFGFVIFLLLKSLIDKARFVAQSCTGAKLGTVSVDKALVIENEFQLDAIIAIMLILHTEVTKNGIAAIKQINCSRLAGSILANESNGVKSIKTIGNSL